MINLPDLESNEESTRVSDQILSMRDILISQVCMMPFFTKPFQIPINGLHIRLV